MNADDRKIKIWIITGKYMPNFSGSAIQAHQILRKLLKRGFSATVLTAGDYEAGHLRGQQIYIDGIQIRYLRTVRHPEWITVADATKIGKIIPYIKTLLGSLSLAALAAWVLWREGQQDEIVRIYAPGQFSFLPIWVALLKGMHPVVHMTLLNSDDPEAIKIHSNKLQATLTLQSFIKAEAITGYSSGQINSYISAGLDPHKVFQIPGGVDLSKFKPVSAEERIKIRIKLGLKPDVRFIIFVGTAIARKGLDVLVKAFLQVCTQVRDVELLIVGPCDFSDPRHKLARNLRDELEAADNIATVHWIGREENVHDYLRVSDIFCFPSRREGFGLVIIEAMAAGLPVVTSRLEGITTDMIRSDREGILISGYSPDDYAIALLQLIKSPSMAEAMGSAAESRAVSEFSLENISQQYAQLYRKIAGVDKA